jgi:5-methylthioadenosine/S-adenosylhomocysteine deaminase
MGVAMTDVLLRGGRVLRLGPGGGPDGERADVLIREGRVAAIAPDLAAAACDVVDASAHIVMPGLVDAHRHVWYAGLRGALVDSTFDGLLAFWARVVPLFTPEDVHAFTAYGLAQALDSGITTVFDWCHITNTPEHTAAAWQAHREAGGRNVFGYAISPANAGAATAGRGSTDWRIVAELNDAAADERVRVAMGLPGLDYAHFAETAVDIATAREFGVPMSFHTAVPQGNAVRGSIRRLDEAGLLGPDMSFVHCCDCTDDEFAALKAAVAPVVLCPSMDATMAMGVAPTGRVRAAGLSPAFGSDAVTTSGGDLFEEARVGLLLDRVNSAGPVVSAGRAVGPDDDQWAAAGALTAVTSSAAAACWNDDRSNGLRVGATADLLLLRAEDSNLFPLGDRADGIDGSLAGGVLASATAANVDAVMVGGQFVKRDGRLLGVDERELRDSVVRARRRLHAAS